MRILFFLLAFLVLTANTICGQTTKNAQLPANTFFKKGIEYHHKNDLKSAILYYSEAIERDKTHSEALYNRAMAYFSQQKYYLCSLDLDEFLRLYPHDRDALERRGNAALMLKKYDESVNFYTRAIQIASSTRLLTNRGLAALESGDPEYALKDFKEALQKDKDFLEAMIGVGNAYFALGEYDKAHNIYKDAQQKGSTDKRLIFNLAISNSKKKAYAAAIVQFTQLLSTQENAEALAQRAFCHYKIGQIDDALLDATKANQLDIRNAFAYNTLGLIHLQEGDADLAEMTYSEGLSWEPNQPELLAGRGFARYKQQQYATALTDLNAAIALAPKLGAAYYTRACIKLMLEEKLDACKDYNKALSIGYEPFTEEDGTNFCEGVSDNMLPKDLDFRN
jgi:tetratricopeptide (TPR) repeat protein